MKATKNYVETTWLLVSALRKQNKGKNQSGSLRSYFLSFKLSWKKKGVLSVNRNIFKNLKIHRNNQITCT